MRRSLPTHASRPHYLAALLNDVYRRIGSNIEADVFNVLAAVPAYFESFWSSVEPAYKGCLVHSAAAELRDAASRSAEEVIRLPNYLDWLSRHGYSREESRQIRYVVEVFYNLEPVFAVLATVAGKWLTGTTAAALTEPPVCVRDSTRAVFVGPIEFVEEHDDVPCLAPMIARHGRPVHSFYRAVAIWPDYLEKVWSDLGGCAPGSKCAAAAKLLSKFVDTLSGQIVASTARYDPAALPAELVTSIQRCQNLSCEVIVVASALRRAFIKAEVTERMKGIRELGA